VEIIGKENRRDGAKREGAGINLFGCGKPPVIKLKSASTSVCMLFRRGGKFI
jgi:hypothetical protein